MAEITGALGTVRADACPSSALSQRLRTFLAIVGPGLIVMVGDNDAGAFGTYTQAGQNYGTALLWTLALCIPVLYVNQEMVLRLGAVTGVGHARLIFARYGRFWGAFSLIDLLVLNALTLVTEFIGIALALRFFGAPKIAGVALAALLLTIAAAQGNFRRFERFCIVLCAGSFLLLPVLAMAHASFGATIHDFAVPAFPAGADPGTVMLLVAAIVGTTIAPWQLFFQQSYVIDKGITARFIAYARWDLIVGIAVVLFGAIAMISFSAATFAGRPEAGHFQDAGAVAAGIARYVGYWPGAFFALALADASLIGAAAVSLSTAYALGDVFAVRHSLHRSAAAAPTFYGAYAVLIALAAALVLIPGVPLGLLTNAVQVLAGVLLPSATAFLLLLSSDEAILGPWRNSRAQSVFAGLVVAVLVALSLVLTCATVFPNLRLPAMLWMLGACAAGGLAIGLRDLASGAPARAARSSAGARAAWTMPPLEQLPRVALTRFERLWLLALRAYLAGAVAIVLYKVIQLGWHAR